MIHVVLPILPDFFFKHVKISSCWFIGLCRCEDILEHLHRRHLNRGAPIARVPRLLFPPSRTPLPNWAGPLNGSVVSVRVFSASGLASRVWHLGDTVHTSFARKNIVRTYFILSNFDRQFENSKLSRIHGKSIVLEAHTQSIEHEELNCKQTGNHIKMKITRKQTVSKTNTLRVDSSMK